MKMITLGSTGITTPQNAFGATAVSYAGGTNFAGVDTTGHIYAGSGLSVRADAVCACGPMPMLRAVKKFAREQGIPAYISLEERMACGVGACLGCVTKTVKTDSHSHVRNARICTEGPVFDAEEVEI